MIPRAVMWEKPPADPLGPSDHRRPRQLAMWPIEKECRVFVPRGDAIGLYQIPAVGSPTPPLG